MAKDDKPGKDAAASLTCPMSARSRNTSRNRPQGHRKAIERPASTTSWTWLSLCRGDEDQGLRRADAGLQCSLSG